MKTVLARWVKAAGICAALALGGFGGAAHAQVVCTSSINWDMNFGEYDGAVKERASSGVLRLSCTNNSNTDRNIKICAQLGNGSGGAEGGWRLMKNVAGQIQYQIYRDSSRTQLFGLVPDHVEVTDNIAANTARVIPAQTQMRIYGRIPAGQTAVPGLYISAFTGADVKIRYADFPPGGEPDCASLPGTEIPYNSSVVVQSYIASACNITTLRPIRFGSRTTLMTNVVSRVGMRVRCDAGLAYEIALDNGQNAQGNQRRMRLGSTSHHIQYELYRANGYTQRWGSADNERVKDTGDGSSDGKQYPVYARVPPQPVTAAGEYKDTVVVTVHY